MFPWYGKRPSLGMSLNEMTPLAPANPPLPETIGWWQRPWISFPVGANFAVNVYDAVAAARIADGPHCIFVTHGGGHVAPPAVDDMGWDWLARGLRSG